MPDISYVLPLEHLTNQIQKLIGTENALAEIQTLIKASYPKIKIDQNKISEIVKLLQGGFPKGTLFEHLKKTTPLKVSAYGFDENVYAQLLARTKLACLIEKNTGAELHAYKLAVLFGDEKAAVEYLDAYYKENSSGSRQVVHDACSYEMPENDDWDLQAWREIAANYMKESGFRKVGIIGRAGQVQETLLKNGNFTLSYQESRLTKNIAEKERELEEYKQQSKDLNVIEGFQICIMVINHFQKCP